LQDHAARYGKPRPPEASLLPLIIVGSKMRQRHAGWDPLPPPRWCH
jgi:hypothetical protein